MCNRHLRRARLRAVSLCAIVLVASHCSASQPGPQETQPAGASQKPDLTPSEIRQLLLQVEGNQKRLERLERDYTYHVHNETEELDKSGQAKKTTTIEAESLTLDGVRVNRVTARNGKALTPEEQRKEDERIDRQVKQRRERRDKLEDNGTETDASGNPVLTVSRILELGTFSRARRELLNGRPSIVLDYAGDPHAKTRSAFEGIVRNLVGTVWVDEEDRVLVRGQGEFRDDFKIGGGLVANVHKGTHFDFRTARQADGVWLMSTVDAGGSARFLLVSGFNGRIHLATSDYRRFRASTTIASPVRVLGPEDEPEKSGLLPDTSQPTAPPMGPRP